MHLLSTFANQNTLFYVGLLIATTSLYALFTLFRLWTDPLRNIPGPLLARFTRLWLFKQVKERHIERKQVELHQEYGSVVRIAPNHYSFDDVSVIKTIYSHSSKFMKSDYYWCLGRPEPGHANVFSERDGKVHSQKRKRVSSLYSMSSLLSYESYVDDCIKTYCSVLSRIADEGIPISIPNYMQFYAFDVVGALTVGKPFGFLEHGSDFQGTIALIEDQLSFGSLLGIYAEWYGWVAQISKILKLQNNRSSLDQYISSNVDEARAKYEAEKGRADVEKDTNKPQNFLEKLLALEGSGKVEALDIWLSIAANIVAGSDTTGISLSAILYFLLRNPKCLGRLSEELASARVSSPITFSEAQQLPYLQATIKESLRLHPAFGVAMPRVVPEEGFIYKEHLFPPGTTVSVNAWAIHYNSSVFGPDAAMFKPERWLKSPSNTAEHMAEMDRCFLSFGAGARTCLGKNISLLEIQKLIPELIKRFDFELETPEQEWTTRNAVFVKQEYKCFVKERSTKKSDR